MPAQSLREGTAEQQAERAAADGDKQVDAHRPGPLLRLREVGDDEREDGRRRQRPTQALRETGGDQERLPVAEPAGGRGGGEQRHAGEEDLFPADEVTKPAGDQQEAAVTDHVGVDDPGEVGLAEVQVVLDDRQRDVHHTGVKNDH